MTFDDLPMLLAVIDVRRQMEESGNNPGSDDWTSQEDSRQKLTHWVLGELMTSVDQRIVDMWIVVRKSSTVDGVKKIELLARVVRAHGGKCFYANRGLGSCSDDVHLDRILPCSRGGKYTLENCVVACGRHNTMRGDKAVEEFLSNTEAST